ncbi:type II secretion system secretin GspD [Chromobacterium sp. IIBBL 290-4]|uniref:type II secretion system secretin GspD n=1 Tax=Chromobacterium sp. IIBBL 290-4 TaxID=2953890 RepID=UPI0020B67CD0|nr:type II secretion system secretin GspD [Chromobacterium sp. IIBBL 290-4]UTH72276.1 type II secretion system secretin GspD [Chromobacterium sp. IIBBL 290-4]
MRISKLVAALALVSSCQLLAAPQNDSVMLNFVNADIETVVKAIGEISGKNFIIDPRVKGTVNIVSSRPVPRALSYQVLLSSLRLQGFAAVEGNGVVKIVPEADAKLHAKASKGIPRGDGDRLITKVFSLKNSNANQLVPVIRPIVSPNNTVAAYPQSNALIVTDYADNIQRIESIIESIETAAAGDTVVIPVLYGSAVELANTLNKLLQEGGDGGGKTTILADPRSNVLMVKADAPGKIGKVKSLLKVLDQPSQAGSNVRVVYLKNAEAGKVAQTLRALLTGDAGPLQGRVAVSTNGSSSGSSGLGTSSSATGTSLGGSSNATPNAAAAPAASSPLSNDASSSGNSQFASGSGSMIQADPTNNALILNVPDTMYQNLRNVIDMLDKRRAQVLVEALVVEMSAQRAMELGVQWQATSGAGIGGTNFTNGVNTPSIISTIGPTGVFNPAALASSAGLNLGWLRHGNLAALAKALETEAGSNVVANPSLLAMDNEKAKILIGQEVPVPTGSVATPSSSTGGTPVVTTSYDRKTIGFNLEITPQISEGGSVRMKIMQETASLQQSDLQILNVGSDAGPTTNRRVLETIANVDDGSILAIGGLLQDSVTDSQQKVPLLGDIPWLGGLFRYSVKNHNKTNLMIFLKPTIIKDELGGRVMAQDRYQYILGDMKQEAKKLPLDLESALKSLPEGGIKSSLERDFKAQPK